MSTKSASKTPRRRLGAPERREIIELAATEVFAQHGYQAASMEEIARRSGVSVPILYDHFQSKQALHRRLLVRHFAELRRLWRSEIDDGELAGERLAKALDGWFEYVQSHTYAWRLLFADTTGDPAIRKIHREVAAASRSALLPLLAEVPGATRVAGSADREALDMLWEIVRAVLQGLALWWYEHQRVPRERIVSTAMNALWLGLERASLGESWDSPSR